MNAVYEFLVFSLETGFTSRCLCAIKPIKNQRLQLCPTTRQFPRSIYGLIEPHGRKAQEDMEVPQGPQLGCMSMLTKERAENNVVNL